MGVCFQRDRLIEVRLCIEKIVGWIDISLRYHFSVESSLLFRYSSYTDYYIMMCAVALFILHSACI